MQGDILFKLFRGLNLAAQSESPDSVDLFLSSNKIGTGETKKLANV